MGRYCYQARFSAGGGVKPDFLEQGPQKGLLCFVTGRLSPGLGHVAERIYGLEDLSPRRRAFPIQLGLDHCLAALVLLSRYVTFLKQPGQALQSGLYGCRGRSAACGGGVEHLDNALLVLGNDLDHLQEAQYLGLTLLGIQPGQIAAARGHLRSVIAATGAVVAAGVPRELPLQRATAADEQACKKEVEELLKRYNCRLRTMQLVLDGQPGPINVDIVSNLRANLGQ